jgi:hypothetical protein
MQEISDGRVVVEDGLVEIEALVAHHGNGRIVIDGIVDTLDERVELEVTAHQLPFDEALREALPAGVREVWDDFDPKGQADVVARIEGRQPEDMSDLGFMVSVDFDDVRARYRHLPVPLTGIRGQLVYDSRKTPAVIGFRGLEADVLGGSVAVREGEVSGEGASAAGRLHVVASDLHLDHEDFATLPGKFDDMRQLLAPDGNVNVDAIIELAGAGLDDVRATGLVCASQVEVRDVVIDDLTAMIVLEDRVLSLPEIDGELYGGAVSGSLQVDTSSFGAYRGSLSTRDVDARRFAQTVFGIENERLRGKLSSELAFSGLGPARESLVGEGWLRVSDGWLWPVPVFLGILDQISTEDDRLGEAPGFKECEARFKIADAMVRFSEINVDANTLRIRGRGDMDFAGALDMVIAAQSTPDVKIPLISDVLSGVAGSLIGFGVTGTYRKPELEVQPIKFVTDILAGFAESAGADIPARIP